MTSKYKFGSGIPAWKGGSPYNITFIVTEDCNLRCKYCYQVHKNHKKVMSFETAKKAVDYFLDNPHIFNAEAVIWDFIGGEPLLQINLIDRITDYIKIQTYEKNHKWFNQYRFDISTNGTLYHYDNVRKFIRKNSHKCNVGISIDGTQKKHDLQRIYADGRGSYDEVVKNVPLWLEDFPDASTKVTIGHDDLPYLKESIIHLWDLGIKLVPANVVFEDVWEEGDDVIFEKQLHELADYIMDNQLWTEVECSLFDDKIGYPNDDENLNRNHCGSGKMIAVDADGNFFPCLRYADYSLKNQKPYIIGNINDGIDFDKVRPFLALDTKSQSDEECIDCEIAMGCAWCQANNYDASTSGTNYQRAKYICKMHKARCRANNYYWGRLDKDFGIRKQGYYGRSHKRHLYFILSDDVIEHCNYKSSQNTGNIMSEQILEKAFKFCNDHLYTPVILHSKNKDLIFDFNQYSKNERIEIVGGNKKLLLKNSDRIITVIDSGATSCEIADEKNCILTLDEKNINSLASMVEELIEKVSRININLIMKGRTLDLDIYERQLKRMVTMLIEYYRAGEMKEINLITDRLFLDRMDNCESGNYNFSVAPNGNFYICPAFYFNTPELEVGSLDEGINLNKEHFKLKNAPYCSKCDVYHCNRCVYLNKLLTNEFNTPSSSQCKKSHLEREMSLLLWNTLRSEDINLPIITTLTSLDYSDPVELVTGKLAFKPYNLKNC